ncbi:saccharopine dehydrogenase NADP-binding domain-containing protein [Cupriavidus alkaliphilus]|uniref:saccharopine dehydrogenase NADP-binding domain-containing protein n=1 Tax=Cupriavidus alkaliphilus TaxID=942866 RepID=UPI0016220FF7|nr:saccharopine dehydrogenase NADP-binding domain-containing protein [Cupriavidus alkaliphilus]MBB2920482.1 homospermidine synthase [Cupriavidus alkaliphilus]
MIEHIVIVGFGCIGQAVLPLLERAWPAAAITVVDRALDHARQALVARHGLHAIHAAITAANFETTLGPLLRPGAFLLNLAPSVCSRDLIALAQAHGAFYVDAGIEPWDYEADAQASHLSNYALRHEMLAFARGREALPTALVAHGANPGLVSVLVKAALMALAGKAEIHQPEPRDRAGWAALARALDVRVVQVAEYDSQQAPGYPRDGEFANTWSAEGFITECLQDAELGWGSHEPALPPDGYRHGYGSGAAIALDRPGHRTRVRSWSPVHGPFDAYLITHNESISIAEYLTNTRAGQPLYRPTVYYAYRPTAATQASMQWLDDRAAPRVRAERILRDEIQCGEDELGVLLMSGRHGAVWHGSRLSVQRARALAPYNTATSLQVASSLVAGMQWMLANPSRGVVESDALDFGPVLAGAAHWWAPLFTQFTSWLPRPGATSLAFTDFLLDRAKVRPDPDLLTLAC